MIELSYLLFITIIIKYIIIVELLLVNMINSNYYCLPLKNMVHGVACWFAASSLTTWLDMFVTKKPKWTTKCP